MEAARDHNVDNWAISFLDRLAPGLAHNDSGTRDILYLASVA
jgi:trehalose 6-phosphate synthase